MALGKRRKSHSNEPHEHASFHGKQPNNQSKTQKRKLDNEVFDAEDDDEEPSVNEEKNNNRRYDWDSQQNFQYELPDQFDDEEIDEEEAFDADDESKYGSLVDSIKSANQSVKPSDKKADKKSKSSKKSKQPGIEASDEEEIDVGGWDEATNDEEGMVTLSELFDAPEEDAKPAAQPVKQIKQSKQSKQSLPDSDDDDDENVDDEANRSELLSMLKNLDKDANNQSNNDDEAFNPSLMEESEFGTLPSFDQSGSSAKLTMNDLLKSLQSTNALMEDDDDQAITQSSLKELKHKLSLVQSSKTNNSIGTLMTPLSEVHQEELTRRLGYQKAKEDVERWTPLIDSNRTADKLVFPLNQPSQSKNLQSANSVSAKFAVDSTLGLESDLAAIIKQYGLKKKEASNTIGLNEEAKMLEDRSLTAEEIEKRRAELSKMKSLLFFNELKVRRMNKIKSKSYRRIKRKQREAAELTIEELEAMDPEAAAEKREKMELDRIRERMSLTHSQKSAWMKRQVRVNATIQNDQVKQSLAQTNQLAQSLKQKAKSMDLEDESNDDDDDVELEYSESEDEQDEEGLDKPVHSKAAHLRATLRALEKETITDPSGAASKAGSGNKSGLLGLKFMQRAIEAKQQQAAAAKAEMMDELKAELRAEMGEESEDDESINQSNQPMTGRRKLAPSETHKRNQPTTQSSTQSTLLPNSFQSVRVGLARGSKSRLDGPITVDMDDDQYDESETQMTEEPLFEVEAFDNNDDNAAGSLFVNSRDQSINPADAVVTAAVDQTEDSNTQSTHSKQSKKKQQDRYHAQPQSNIHSTSSSTSIDSTDPSLTEENPWAADSTLPTRKELRETDQKARRRKTAQSTTDTQSTTTPANIDLSSLLIAGSAASTDRTVMNSSQAALVAEAFATAEDEAANFAALKHKLIEEDLPSVDADTVNASLPGWGHWAGEGVGAPKKSSAREKREAEKLAAAQAKRARAVSCRADAKLPHVVITQKTDKKATKYLVPQLPFPYTSTAAFEESLSQPIGREWNAYKAHQKVIEPRIQIKQGSVIEPLQFDANKAKQLAQKNPNVFRNIQLAKNKKQPTQRKGLMA